MWFFVGLIGLGGVLYGVDLAMSEGTVPRGVTVGGVDISGVDKSQAEQRLRNDLGERTRQPVTVNAGNMSSTIEPTQSGMQVDWGATVDQAGQQPLNPITRIRSFFETREVGIISRITDESLNRSLNRVERELTRDPQNAALTVNNEGKADIKEDKPGQTVDRELLATEVRENWLNTDGRVNVEATITPADADKDQAVRGPGDGEEPGVPRPRQGRWCDHPAGLALHPDLQGGWRRVHAAVEHGQGQGGAG